MNTDENKPLIIVEDLVQIISRKVVLDSIRFTVNKGECMGIFGTRGSGKTTLLHILAGIERFHSGSVEVLSCKLPRQQKFKKNMGLVTQKRSLFRDLRTGENFDFIAALKGAGRHDIERVVHELELESYLKEPVSLLDAGVYQRVSLACAMLNSPQLLILDEVIKDIDLYSRHLIVHKMTEFQEQGGTLVCGFSNIEFCGYMDRVGWLEAGKIDLMNPREVEQKWESMLATIHIEKGEADA